MPRGTTDLPGGLPGATRLDASKRLLELTDALRGLVCRNLTRNLAQQEFSLPGNSMVGLAGQFLELGLRGRYPAVQACIEGAKGDGEGLSELPVLESDVPAVHTIKGHEPVLSSQE